MPRSHAVLFSAILSTLLLTQCKKEDSAIFDAGFYNSSAGSRLNLYIDGVYKGALPFFAAQPVCGAANSDAQLPLTMRLPSGTYQLVAKDSLGQIKSVATIRIGTSKNSVSGGMGGASMFNNGSCVIVGMSE